MCKGVSTTIDPFWDISLDLPAIADGSTISLDFCLNRFTQAEHLGSMSKIRLVIQDVHTRFKSCKSIKYQGLYRLSFIVEIQVQQVQLAPGEHQAVDNAEVACCRLFPLEKVTKSWVAHSFHKHLVFFFRFEHSSRLHKKITTRVDFPEIVDMSPYISHARY